MQQNFIIFLAINLRSESFSYDLHNDFDIKFVRVDLDKKNLIMELHKNPGEWVAAALPDKLYLKFLGVQYFSFSENFFLNTNTNIQEFGYKDPDDSDMDWLIEESTSKTDRHLIMRFDSDEYLRILAKEAIVSTEE